MRSLRPSWARSHCATGHQGSDLEASTPESLVTGNLITYHRLPAAGGVGMTTVTYLAVSPGSRTGGEQIYWRPAAMPGL